MSQLFGFPSGLSGGSKETEYTTNWNTNRTTNYTTNWTYSYNTSWSASSWNSVPDSAPSSSHVGWVGYAQYHQYSSGSTNAGFVLIEAQYYSGSGSPRTHRWHSDYAPGYTGGNNSRSDLEGAMLNIMSGISVYELLAGNVAGSQSVYAKAASPINSWAAHPTGSGFPNNYTQYNKSYWWYIQVHDTTSYSQSTSRGTSKTTSKTTTYSTGQTTSHITYG